MANFNFDFFSKKIRQKINQKQKQDNGKSTKFIVFSYSKIGTKKIQKKIKNSKNSLPEAIFSGF